MLLFANFRTREGRTVDRRSALVVPIVTLLFTGSAHAQKTTDLVGAWTLVSNVAERDGKVTDNFGPNPRGLALYHGNGRYSIIVMRADLPKFSQSRENATAEESLAVTKGSLAYFGTYTVSERSIVSKIEGSTFPNWMGETQKRPFTISGDELRIINPLTSSTIVWRRVQ